MAVSSTAITTRGQRLRAARKARFRSARAAAVAFAIPVSTYGAHERAQLAGGRDYGPEEAERYASMFGVAPEWLLMGHPRDSDRGLASRDATKLSGNKLRVVGYLGSGAQIHLYAVAPEDLEEVEAPILVGESTVAIEIRGNSLGPQFNRWFLVFDDVRQRAKPWLINRLCVVAVTDNRVLVRKLQQGQAKDHFDLAGQVGPTISNVKILWATAVKAMIPRVAV